MKRHPCTLSKSAATGLLALCVLLAADAQPVPVIAIAITVMDVSGAVIPDAHLGAYREGTLIQDVKTGQYGDALLTLPGGPYELRVDSRGFRAARRQIDASAQRAHSITVVLQVAPSLPFSGPVGPVVMIDPLQKLAPWEPPLDDLWVVASKWKGSHRLHKAPRSNELN
jgi:hypothetical protein